MINMFDYDYDNECDCEKERRKEMEKERETEGKKKTVCNCCRLFFVIKTSLLAVSALGIVFILKKISSLDGGPDL
jgi:hypothetical protein